LGDSPFYVLPRENSVADSKEESKWHAAVLRDEHGACFLMDLKSSTGTYMDQVTLEPLKPYRWKPGTVAVLGIPKLHDKATLQVDGQPVAPRGQKRTQEAAENKLPDSSAKRQNNGVGSASAADICKVVKSSKCDKCDGPHATEACPHFKKTRENHKDAWANYGNQRPRQLGCEKGSKLFVKHGQEVRQPGDGSCLFHSLCFGLNGGRSNGRFTARQLRKDLANFVMRNPGKEVAGDTLEEWVRWDARSSVSAYTRRMASGGWGGGIEMAACCLSHKVNVHVYERRRGGFERISCFNSPQPTKQTIHVLYQGGVHYDALVPRL
jgi:hypothetical protein